MSKDIQKAYYDRQIKKGLVKRSYYHSPEHTKKIKEFIKSLEKAP